MSMKKARILVNTPLDGIDYKPNQVIEAEAATIKDLVNAGFADDKPAAVKYCLEEGEEVITHQGVTAESEAAVITDDQTGELAPDDEPPDTGG
ncbi:hypothetical protein [Sedimenticola selenatireducens]|uniref:Uncharacterized protein n=1 Tax=Sedimenticola selenatireducens TaxID=191960 RepID=A0A557SCI8_9GAMM|nr:hypothetical protein [Sedimenticola selenatireducens]TVO75132.1 hypothetical protein FHP88_08960 [Sedimenticola selenatireducens]TVT67013.1 MAG: hypothetical protein FHK78_01395 [Sedimenticola selenatireducens]